MMDFINMWLSSFRKSMQGKPIISATVPTGPAIKSRPTAEERRGSDAANRSVWTSSAWNAAVLDESDLDLSSKLRLSLTTAPDAQSLM
ncbi:hypothetical protein V5279_33375 [Bradyrhizobium sp. 26S5]|uniref:hypothetical protein n=1 Tax=Bradyrhizobium sp. 26S5 TaxID=3139729 RepID=UPI0030D626C0